MTTGRRDARRSEEPSWRRHGIALAAVAAVVVLAYSDSFDGGFVLDSGVLVLENPTVRRASAANVGFLLTHDYWQPMATGGLYRPATMLSLIATPCGNWPTSTASSTPGAGRRGGFVPTARASAPRPDAPLAFCREDGGNGPSAE